MTSRTRSIVCFKNQLCPKCTRESLKISKEDSEDVGYHHAKLTPLPTYAPSDIKPTLSICVRRRPSTFPLVSLLMRMPVAVYLGPRPDLVILFEHPGNSWLGNVVTSCGKGLVGDKIKARTLLEKVAEFLGRLRKEPGVRHPSNLERG